MKNILFLVGVMCLSASVLAQDKPAAKATEVDELQLQIVILKSQLAQALSASAKCEAEGPQAAKVSQEAQSSGQALLKSLDARGLMMDGGKIVPKPDPAKTETKKPEGGK